MDKKYVVYQHVTPDNMYYFGATSNIKRRWKGNGSLYKGTSLYPYIEKFGWNNIQHIVLFREQTKENALWIEDFLIETAREDGVCINQQRSGYISKEEDYYQRQYKQYREQNKDKILEYQREYREQNKDKIREYQREYNREYREQNKDKIREYKREYNREYYREYREQNKDKIREYQREYQRKYRERKKLEKQLKEAVETTLF